MREFLYYIGLLIFIGSIVIAVITFFYMDVELIGQVGLIIVAPILIPGMGFGAILLGLWKLIEIQEKKLKIFE